MPEGAAGRQTPLRADCACLQPIVRSLESTGRAACMLPADPLCGTGIPGCSIVIDKAGAAARVGNFMNDGARGIPE